MKKIFVTVLIAVLGISAFANVDVKKRADGKFDIHWSYPNPRAQEVYLAGDLTNWDQGKQLMERDENGIWYFDMTVPSGFKCKYKFVVDGAWFTDVNGTEFENDGLGGKNTVVNVDKMTRPPKNAKKGKKPSKNPAKR